MSIFDGVNWVSSLGKLNLARTGTFFSFFLPLWEYTRTKKISQLFIRFIAGLNEVVFTKAVWKKNILPPNILVALLKAFCVLVGREVLPLNLLLLLLLSYF